MDNFASQCIKEEDVRVGSRLEQENKQWWRWSQILSCIETVEREHVVARSEE